MDILTVKKHCLKRWWESSISILWTVSARRRKEFADLPPKEQPENLSSISGLCMEDMLLYAYEHLEVFKFGSSVIQRGTRFPG